MRILKGPFVCGAAIAWEVIDFVWGLPGRIDDTKDWTGVIQEMGSVDWSDWVTIALLCIGLAITAADLKAGRSLWKPEKRLSGSTFPFGRKPTWPSVNDEAATPLNPYKLACWLDRREPRWPLLSKASRHHYDAIIAALIDEDQFGNELPLGSQSPPWAHPWAAQVYWERAVEKKGKPNKEHEIELTRSLVRRYLRSIDHPIPEFLDEKYDDRFPWK